MNTIEFTDQLTQLSTQINNSLTSGKAITESKEELYNFLDMNYETYINSNSEERTAIRETCKKLCNSFKTNNFLNLFLLGYIQRTIENIEFVGEKTWLMRGLIVIAIEDGILDHRDNLDLLAHLFVAAEEKALNPKVEFQKIAKISNNKSSLSRATPMSQVILEIPGIAHKINEDRKKYL